MDKRPGSTGTGQNAVRRDFTAASARAVETLSQPCRFCASYRRLQTTGEGELGARANHAAFGGIESDMHCRARRIAFHFPLNKLARRRIKVNIKSLDFRSAAGALLVSALLGCGGGGDGQTGSEASAASTNGVAGTSVAGVSASADSAALSCGLNQPTGIEQEMLARVNQLRSNGVMCGATPYPSAPSLKWNAELLQAAAGHSTDMATSNYFSHISLDGRTPPQRLKQPGYDYASMGENIAAGQISVEAVVAAWVASPDHCRNMMNPVFRDIAVACVANPGTTYVRYWTMELGREL